MEKLSFGSFEGEKGGGRRNLRIKVKLSTIYVCLEK
jgi:hypothetical protein